MHFQRNGSDSEDEFMVLANARRRSGREIERHSSAIQRGEDSRQPLGRHEDVDVIHGAERWIAIKTVTVVQTLECDVRLVSQGGSYAVGGTRENF